MYGKGRKGMKNKMGKGKKGRFKVGDWKVQLNHGKEGKTKYEVVKGT